MKKLIYLIVLTLILGLVLTGCLLSDVGQVPTTGQSGIASLTKNGIDPDPGLVGLWHFDEESGITAYDSSGNGNNGDLMGDTSWTSGKFGNALYFDGDGDYVQLPASNTILNTDTFTIEAWFKTSVNHPAYGGTEGRIVNLARDNVGFSAVALYVEKDNIAVCYRTTTEFKHLKYEVYYHDSVWHHIAVTRDANTYKLYYDGLLVASQTDTFYDFGISAAYIATFNSSERFFQGTIDEVRIYDYALSPETIKGHAAGIYGFNGLLPPYAPPEQKAFKLGRTIPLKWQYTDPTGNVVDSADANPTVEWTHTGDGTGTGTLDEGLDDPGASGLQYDALTMTWQFNWQTKGRKKGTYEITITSDQAESSPIFEIALRE